MNGSTWIFDAWSGKTHHPDCTVWNDKVSIRMCNCAELEDEMVEHFQAEQPYQRTVTVPQTDPNAPHQSLASLIRAARRAGHLRPLQPYGGGRQSAQVP